MVGEAFSRRRRIATWCLLEHMKPERRLAKIAVVRLHRRSRLVRPACAREAAVTLRPSRTSARPSRSAQPHRHAISSRAPDCEVNECLALMSQQSPVRVE